VPVKVRSSGNLGMGNYRAVHLGGSNRADLVAGILALTR
jgi:hypothetical protein